MKLDNYETIKKSQWQEIATQFGVVYQEDSVIRYLVEKLAEKIGVDDKIVSDRELKRKVVEKINSQTLIDEGINGNDGVEGHDGISDIELGNEVSLEPIAEELVAEEPIVEEPIVEEPIVEEPVAEEPVAQEPVVEEPIAEEPVAEEPVAEEPVAEEPVTEEPVVQGEEEQNILRKIGSGIVTGAKKLFSNQLKEEPVVEEPVAEEPVAEELPQLTRMEQLRLECESYGVAWAENHTEANLEQVLNGVKSAGVQPIKDVPTFSAPVEKELDVTQAFEITSENVDEVSSLIDVSKLNNPAYNPLAVEQKPIVNGGYNNSNTYLDIFKNMYLNAIKNHWRVLSYNEISEMILRDKQTFTFEINFHPSQSNKVEIILKQDNNSVRIPSSDTNDWLEING